MLDAVQKEGVCSESIKTKLIKPEALMWEGCIITGSCKYIWSLEVYTREKVRGLSLEWESQEQRPLGGKVAQLPTEAQDHNCHCIIQDFPQQMLSVVRLCIRLELIRGVL